MPILKSIQNNLDRKVINAGITMLGQFKFENDDPVNEGIPFHIYYTNDKREIYATGEDFSVTSEIIIRLKGNTTFRKYMLSKNNSVNNTIILKSITLNIKKKDYDRGFVNRYFARQANDINTDMFEISKKDFRKKTPYYIKGVIIWKLTGSEELVIENNSIEVLFLREFFTNPSFNLSLLKYWQPPTLNKRSEILKKLNF